MKLYSGPLSLYSRKVEIVLAEKGLRYERIMVPFSQTAGYHPKAPEVVAINPRGQVPMLIDGEVALYDSTVILEYLEDAYPEPPLMPSIPSRRAACRLLDVYADEVMIAPLRALMHRTGPGAPEAEDWTEREAQARMAEAAIDRQLAHLDAALGGKASFCDVLSVADAALFMSVLYGQRLGGPALTNHPRLRTWFTRLLKRPAFATVLAEVRAADAELSRVVPGAYAGLDIALAR